MHAHATKFEVCELAPLGPPLAPAPTAGHPPDRSAAMPSSKPKEVEKPRAAEVRAAKMEAAWRSHVGKLTLAQMSSPAACVEHLGKYGAAQGWQKWML